MDIAVITGASSGMGREYARLADKSGAHDELWIVARRKERLEELERQCTTPVRIICADLGSRESVDRMAAMLSERKSADATFHVSLLVNAAGFGKFGTFEDMSLDEVDSMINLNCRALVDMTQTVLPYMERGSRIIEFASSAAFQPLPGLNVYAASKAFVLSYTRALRRELHGRGIFVTAVCPIWIKTEFVDVARDTRNGQTVRHPWPQLDPRRVAQWSTFVNRCNYPVATCSAIAFLMRVFCKLLPSPLIMWIWAGLRRI